MSNAASLKPIVNTESDELFRSQQFLPTCFTPGSTDVILGRGKKCSNHQGNKNLRSIVASRLEEYSTASTKSEKSQILSAVVTQIRNGNPKGKFIKQDADAKLWFDVGDVLAKEKISQTFRDALVGMYRSSNEFKKKRRSEMKKEENAARSVKRARIQPNQTSANDYLNQMQYLLAYGSVNHRLSQFNSDSTNLAALSRQLPTFEDFNPTHIPDMSQVFNQTVPNMSQIFNQTVTAQNSIALGLDSSIHHQNNKLSARKANRMMFDFRPNTNINSAKTA